jgi:hypothetical protein
MLQGVAELLTATLNTIPPSELESHLVATLRQDYFLLGDPAKHTTLAFFQRCVQQRLAASDLNGFLDDLWEIHQVEDAESLPTSDVVARFILKYNAS